MKYALKTAGTAAQLDLSGSLTFAEAPQFPKILTELESIKSLTKLEIDLGELNFIDSTGMSLFVHIYDASQSRNIKVSVLRANGPVASALERAAFKTLFEFR
ncbi:hypothetical protein CCC_02125 [Paramagnetospirillum magnetotacticum MS-1]|uniref:STAS domain-containing protein n=1 Tax=Paramagnetospirillum magnetotacticum MS-1 TaxID=272627 RepID=A0A0C2YVE8_PARME|nr:STAS domain-containing protein [Paramagnetospirillum magnetotacticum]KIL98675.1 hypothetical protein CCC_02125 [Paramagnetospirillum magnetotacticum MS-1]